MAAASACCSRLREKGKKNMAFNHSAIFFFFAFFLTSPFPNDPYDVRHAEIVKRRRKVREKWRVVKIGLDYHQM